MADLLSVINADMALILLSTTFFTPLRMTLNLVYYFQEFHVDLLVSILKTYKFIYPKLHLYGFFKVDALACIGSLVLMQLHFLFEI